jgi:hypothetical protein
MTKQIMLWLAEIAMMAILVSGCGAEPGPSPSHTPLATSPGPTGLPIRATPTPSSATPFMLPTALITPMVTSPFTFPTRPPDVSPTPAHDCTSVFPLESVERITFGETTATQLEAAFGRAVSRGGRPPALRFERGTCTLIVTLGIQEAQEAELRSYGSLGLLLDRYGPPAAVGISQGNLTLLAVGNAVLLYPDQGLIAIFDAEPDALDRATPISHLYFRPAYATDKQIARLNLRSVENWSPPLR